MNADAIRFEFDSEVPLQDAEMSLHLALIATEGLFGRALVRLEAEYELDEDHHVIGVDAGTEVGAVVVRVFTALLIREFGEEAFSIQRTNPQNEPDDERKTANGIDQPSPEGAATHATTAGGVRDGGHRKKHVCGAGSETRLHPD